jgi:hypothetical protein
MEFAVWEACERFGIRPPGVKPSWDEMEEDIITQSLLLAYNQIRTIEDQQWDAQCAGAKV